MADAGSIKKVIEIVKSKSGEGPLVVVASALGGITNQLEKCGNLAKAGDEGYKALLKEVESRHLAVIDGLFSLKDQSGIKGQLKMLHNELEDICQGLSLLREMNPATHDRLLSFGERFSGLIISEALRFHNLPLQYADAREMIVTDEDFGNARVDFNETRRRVLHKLGNLEQLAYVPGFIASTSDGVPSTLGRGGSDYTAAILAALLDAERLEIWTDVDGVMTADPAFVENAKPLKKLSYIELMEMSHFGAKVIFPPSIQPVMSKNIPVLIKNTFRPEAPGTLIDGMGTPGGNLVKGLSHIENIALLTLSGGGMVGVTGTAARLFSCLSQQGVNVIFITQASSEHSITLAVADAQIETARKAVDKEFSAEQKLGIIDPLVVETGLSIIALVGDNMKSSLGLSGKAFDALGKNGVNIRAIAQGSTERNISCVVRKSDVTKALNVLHERFFLGPHKRVNLFMMGVGNVGEALLRQIGEQYDYLKNEYALKIKVVALANSRRMLFKQKGIDFGNWRQQMEAEGEPVDGNMFLAKMREMNLRNAVFVDNTASEAVASLYESVLKSSVSVVASNKIASSGPYAE